MERGEGRGEGVRIGYEGRLGGLSGWVGDGWSVPS